MLAISALLLLLLLRANGVRKMQPRCNRRCNVMLKSRSYNSGSVFHQFSMSAASRILDYKSITRIGLEKDIN